MLDIDRSSIVLDVILFLENRRDQFHMESFQFWYQGRREHLCFRRATGCFYCLWSQTTWVLHPYSASYQLCDLWQTPSERPIERLK